MTIRSSIETDRLPQNWSRLYQTCIRPREAALAFDAERI